MFDNSDSEENKDFTPNFSDMDFNFNAYIQGLGKKMLAVSDNITTYFFKELDEQQVPTQVAALCTTVVVFVKNVESVLSQAAGPETAKAFRETVIALLTTEDDPSSLK